jgi:hypothetical protein
VRETEVVDDSVTGVLPFGRRDTGVDYYLTRAVLLRSIGFMYLVGFAIAWHQVLPLIGSRGLLPVSSFVEGAVEHLGSRAALALRLPSLFLIDASDLVLRGASLLGVVLAALVLAGVANSVILGVLWALYVSLVHVGQTFYGYGWEILLCEAGVLAIFLAPAWRIRLFEPRDPPPFVVIVLYRWLLFRVMFGAGLIKLRGDPCWTDLSCLFHHFETQPNPGPLSAWFHALPRPVLEGGVVMNHLVEVVAPFFVFGPRRARVLAGCLMIAFQLVLIVSGNLSFLNWLTLVIALSCLDDHAMVRWLRPASLDRLKWLRAKMERQSRFRRGVLVGLALLIGMLSLNPVVNLLSTRQRMNGSFDPLMLVNTYGAFGSVLEERREVVIEGTASEDPSDESAYVAYEFPCKPTDVARRPCLVTPYHHRLDWQLWFASFSEVESEPWLVHFVYQLLEGAPGARSLLARDPFPGAPPRFVRARLFSYRFRDSAGEGPVWERSLVGEYMTPVSSSDPRLLAYLRRQRLLP